LSKNVLLNSASTGARAVGFTGVISGGFGVTKTGIGQVRLSGANTYSGATTIRTGTLLVAADVPVSTNSPLGNAASAILLADATSAVTDNITLAIDGAFTIGRGVTVNTNNSTGVSTLTATNATSTTATYGGTIQLNKNAVLANATAGATTLFSGAINGAGFGVTINGPGIVEFGGAGVNGYTGTTTVASGTLRLNRNFGGNNTIAGGLSISGGTLVLAGSDQLPDSLVLTLSGGAFDVGNFAETITDLNYTGGTILNGGNLVLTGSQDLFLFDGTTINAAANINRHILYLGSTTAATVNAPLALDSDPTHDLSVNNGTAAVDVTFNGAITNDGVDTPTSLIKKGQGTVVLSGVNTFGGAGQTFELQGGTVIVTADNQLGKAANTVTLNGGALRFGAAFPTTRTFVIGAGAGALDAASGVTQTLAANGRFPARGISTRSARGKSSSRETTAPATRGAPRSAPAR
jgi:autotransporter-associated beta strand protein